MKWAGGKGQLLEPLRQFYMGALGGNIQKYAEPFVGGGAVLFDILTHCTVQQVYISDINAELINAYRAIQAEAPTIVATLSGFQSDYWARNDEARKEYYYARRDEFNRRPLQAPYDPYHAALFIFLNRTCYNGLYRVNKKGAFNVPIGKYKQPLICNEENLLAVSVGLKQVEIVCGDYQQAAKFIDQNTLVYFDPPYRPLNQTSNFTSYAELAFNDAEQIRLASFINQMNAVGARILLSNSDPKNIDENDTFFDTLYRNYHISRVRATRTINSRAAGRGRITELLIDNF